MAYSYKTGSLLLQADKEPDVPSSKGPGPPLAQRDTFGQRKGGARMAERRVWK